MSQLGQREHLHEARVIVLEFLAHRGQLRLCELPVAPLRRVPVVGGHVDSLGSRARLSMATRKGPVLRGMSLRATGRPVHLMVSRGHAGGQLQLFWKLQLLRARLAAPPALASPSSLSQRLTHPAS